MRDLLTSSRLDLHFQSSEAPGEEGPSASSSPTPAELQMCLRSCLELFGGLFFFFFGFYFFLRCNSNSKSDFFLSLLSSPLLLVFLLLLSLRCVRAPPDRHHQLLPPPLPAADRRSAGSARGEFVVAFGRALFSRRRERTKCGTPGCSFPRVTPPSFPRCLPPFFILWTPLFLPPLSSSSIFSSFEIFERKKPHTHPRARTTSIPR